MSQGQRAGSGTSSGSLYGRNWEGDDVASGFPGRKASGSQQEGLTG